VLSQGPVHDRISAESISGVRRRNRVRRLAADGDRVAIGLHPFRATMVRAANHRNVISYCAFDRANFETKMCYVN
jgi:hypothetical protein